MSRDKQNDEHNFAGSDNEENTQESDTPTSNTHLFIAQTLLEHPEWVKTATVLSPESGTLRLIHIASSSTVVGYNSNNEKFYFPLDSPLVSGAKWVNGSDIPTATTN